MATPHPEAPVDASAGRWPRRREARAAAGGREALAPEAVAPQAVAAAVATALLLGLPVAFRGLYFPPQQLLAVVAACLVAGFVWWVRGRGSQRLLRGSLDAAVLAVAASYLLSLPVAAAPDQAVQSWILRLLYFLAFWSAAEVARLGVLPRRIVLWGVLLGGAIAALSGVAAAAGAFAGHGFFLGGRIYTSIQYPDAAAAYLAAVAFVALGLAGESRAPWVRALYAVSAATSLFAFVFALSRGATLVFVPVAVAWLVASGRRAADAAAGLVGALLGVGAGALPYLKGLARVQAGHHGGPLLVWAGLGVAWAVAAACALGWEAWRAAPARVRLASGLASLLVVLAAAGLAAHRLAHSLLARLGRVSPEDYNAWSRLQWIRDALRLVRAHPILGLGGGGWAAAYRTVQSYFYTSTQVHSGWVQDWVSTGTVGFLCWCALWVVLGVVVVRAWRRADPARRPLVVGLAAAAAMLGGHAVIDFTLSLGGISVALFGVMGVLRSLAEAPEPATAAPAPAPARRARPWATPVAVRRRRAVRPPSWATLGFYGGLTALGIFALTLWAGGHRIVQASRDAAMGDLLGAQGALQAAVADDPWSATAYLDLAQVEDELALQATTGSSAQLLAFQQANQDYQRALARSRYGWVDVGQIRTYYGQFLEQTGQLAEAVQVLRQGLADGPYVSSAYDALDLALVDLAASDAHQHRVAAGRRVLAEIAEVARERARYAAAIPPQAALAIRRGQAPAFPPTDPGMQLAAGEAAAMEGRWRQATADLGPVLSQPGAVGGEANLWVALVEERLHEPRLAAAHLAAAQRDLGPSFAQQETLVRQVVGALAARG